MEFVNDCRHRDISNLLHSLAGIYIKPVNSRVTQIQVFNLLQLTRPRVLTLFRPFVILKTDTTLSSQTGNKVRDLLLTVLLRADDGRVFLLLRRVRHKGRDVIINLRHLKEATNNTDA